jgi:hypothetical protein
MGFHKASVLAAALVVVLVAVIWAYVRTCRRGLYGMWVGDPAFLKRASLSSLSFYIADPQAATPEDDRPGECTDPPPTHRGYVILADQDGKLLVNQPVNMRVNFKSGPVCAVRGLFMKTRTMRGSITTCQKISEWPLTLNFTLSLTDGSLSLNHDDTVYALTYKDGAATHAAGIGLEQ